MTPLRLRGVVMCFLLAGVSLLAAHEPVAASAGEPLVLVAGKHYPPMSYIKDGVATGMYVDVAAALAKVLGREVRVELMDWTAARQAVLRGEADGLLSMSTSPERARLYDFTEPTTAHEIGLFVRSDEISIRDAMDLTGRKVGVIAGSMPQILLEANGAANLVLIDDYYDGFRRLAAGTISAVAGDLWVGAYTIEQRRLRDIVRTGPPLATLATGIALRKGNSLLVDEVSQAIRTLKLNGTIERIEDRWRPQSMLFVSRARMQMLLTLAGAGFLAVLLLGTTVWATALRRQLRAQARHREAEGRVHLLAQALQSASDCISITDTSDRILYANEAFLRTYEYEERDLLGQHIGIVRSTDNVPGVLDRIYDVTKQEGWHGVVRNRARTGRVFPVSLSTSMVHDEHGQIIGLVGVARDRTSEEAAEAALRASEEKYRQVVENANDIIFIVDPEGYCLSMNRAGREISGYVAEDPRGVNLKQLVAPEQIGTALRQLQRVLSGEEVPSFELDMVSKSGKRMTLELDVRVIRSATGITGVQGIARDVTTRKELEANLRQAQKMEAIGRLAGGVAHDFNNVLTVVMGTAELAAMQLDEESPVRRDLEEIQRAADSAASLTRQLLIFSRKGVFHPAVLDLNEVVTRLNKLLRRLVGEDIEFIVRAGGALAHIMADASQIEQVIMNLVVNARDAMPTGGRLTIETSIVSLDDSFVRAHQGAAAGEFVRLTVTDTGVGMTADVLAQIFTPFFTTKGPSKGTGLGLATVHGIVQQVGGCITVKSTPGHGAAFAIDLPRVRARVAHAPLAAHLAAHTAVSGTILFVEDEESVRTMGTRALRQFGYTVLPARDATEAISVAERHPGIDLLLTDIVMPGLNGHALAEYLHQAQPDLKVLYTSGYTSDSAALADMLAAGGDFLEKPYTQESLAREVRRAMQRHVARPATPGSRGWDEAVAS